MDSNSSSIDRRKFLQAAMGGAACGAAIGPWASANGQSASMPVSIEATARANSGLSWPERGNFAFKPLVAPHRASAKAMLDAREFFGLERESLALYGCVRSQDGEMYELCRRIPGVHGRGVLNGLFMLSTVGKDALRIVPEAGMQAATSLNHQAELRDDTAIWRSDPAAAGNPFQVTFSNDGGKCTWMEKGLFDLEGELLGPGLQWYLPSTDTSMFYVSQLFEVNGNLRGKPVRGIIGFDDIYLPRGVILYAGGDPLTRHKNHRAWYTWATRYKDGSFDAGHFMLGHDRLGFSIVTNEHQQLVLSTDVSGEVVKKMYRVLDILK